VIVVILKGSAVTRTASAERGKGTHARCAVVKVSWMGRPPMLEPRRFRKKPVEIEAIQYLPGGEGHNCGGVAAFLGMDPMACCVCFEGNRRSGGRPLDCEDREWTILTLEGAMKASPGDWIIKGVEGEFYPCRASIFEATYEEA
jgi:hypothetical protein